MRTSGHAINSTSGWVQSLICSLAPMFLFPSPSCEWLFPSFKRPQKGAISCGSWVRQRKFDGFLFDQWERFPSAIFTATQNIYNHLLHSLLQSLFTSLVRALVGATYKVRSGFSAERGCSPIIFRHFSKDSVNLKSVWNVGTLFANWALERNFKV